MGQEKKYDRLRVQGENEAKTDKNKQTGIGQESIFHDEIPIEEVEKDLRDERKHPPEETKPSDRGKNK
ncbi:hypothetical protein [Salsuginibacillus kocurii]|uniref:hypothetical protein n=1 Tax=Salsuginibacillus kocurii TaxID=427078 RepID=UPI000368169D|nr:hypothetical protein [Salsuginibacillus kocurii]